MKSINSLNINHQDKVNLIIDRYSKNEISLYKQKIQKEMEALKKNDKEIKNDFKNKQINTDRFLSKIIENNNKIEDLNTLSLLLDDAIACYPLDITVIPKHEIRVSYVNIRNSNGNRVRKDVILQPSKTYKVIKEFVSSGAFRGGENCYVIQDKNNWTYNVKKSDFMEV